MNTLGSIPDSPILTPPTYGMIASGLVLTISAVALGAIYLGALPTAGGTTQIATFGAVGVLSLIVFIVSAVARNRQHALGEGEGTPDEIPEIVGGSDLDDSQSTIGEGIVSPLSQSLYSAPASPNPQLPLVKQLRIEIPHLMNAALRATTQFTFAAARKSGSSRPNQARINEVFQRGSDLVSASLKKPEP